MVAFKYLASLNQGGRRGIPAPEMSPAGSTTLVMQQPPLQQLRPSESASPQLAAAQEAAQIAPARPTGVPMLPTRVRQPGRQAPLPDAVAIRRLAVPDGAPPFDDEVSASRLEPSGAAVNGDNHRGNDASHPIPAVGPGGPADPGQQDAPDQPLGPHGSGSPGGLPGSGGVSQLRGADGWPVQFAQVLAETLAGSRPAHQLTPWTTEQARRRIRQLGPLLATDQRPRVRRVLTSAPAKDVLELAAVVGFGPRVRALALRLERAEGGAGGRTGSTWCCTAIESA